MGKMDLFSTLDKNGDGMVTKDECKNPGGEAEGNAFMEACMNSEGECDGTINMDECVNYMEGGSPDSGTGPVTCLMKDLDGDGLLGEDEMSMPMTFAVGAADGSYNMSYVDE